MTARTLLLLLSPALLTAAEWPQWRGPDGMGHSTAKNLPLTWSETSNIAWKAELPGRGWSSPVIDGNQIWVTTAVETKATPEAAKKRLEGKKPDQPLTLLDTVELRALCVDRDSGKLLHNVLLITKTEPQAVHELNSYASPSPVLDDGRLYCHFGTFGTACVDIKTSKLLWTNTTLEINHENGPGSTPIIYADKMIVHLDGSDRQFIAALNKNTGKVAWKTDRSGEMRSNPQMKKSYGTPVVVKINGKDQIVSPASDWVYSYDPATGKELWKLSYGVLGFSVVPRPVVGNGFIYMSTGFMKPELLAIKYEGVKEPRIEWRISKGSTNMPSPLLIGDEIYIVNDGGILLCANAHTGEEYYRERLGGKFSSSPIYADGKLYVGSREGIMFVVQPGKQFKILAQNTMEGAIMATPAAVDGALFVRTDKGLFRLGAKP